uniref:Uncharacterized protein n=1 Tax=Oryza brachyantha TaxID=4533 RepID=J3KV66_ORYBR
MAMAMEHGLHQLTMAELARDRVCLRKVLKETENSDPAEEPVYFEIVAEVPQGPEQGK